MSQMQGARKFTSETYWNVRRNEGICEQRGRWAFLGSPTIAVVMLLPGCNMTCNFCITKNAFSVMSFQGACQLVACLNGAGIHNIVLGGGEPLAWPYDVFRLARYAKAQGFTVQLGTNGIALPDDFAWRDEIDRYVLPLESSEAHLHNRMRQYRNKHHTIILKRLAELTAAQKGVTVSTVVSQINAASLERLALFLAQYRHENLAFHAWHLYQFIPEGRGGRVHAKKLLLDAQRYDEVCRELKRQGQGLTIYKRKNMFVSQNVAFYWQEGDTLRSLLPRALRQPVSAQFGAPAAYDEDHAFV